MLNYVKFRRGTKQEYQALLKKDNDTLYFISDPGDGIGTLYLGSQLIAGEGSVSTGAFNLSNLKDINLQSLNNNDVLVYNSETQKWENKQLPIDVPEVKIIQNDSKKTHDDLLQNNGLELLQGNICIIKDLIANDKYSYTAYVYDGSIWQAMDGNYNAKNVYFDKDFIFTTNVGTIKVDSSGSAKVPAAGQNVAEFIEKLFSSPEDPKVVQPSVSVTLTEAKKYEVGTTVVPNYTTNFNPGSYSYDTSTGVTITSWEISDTNQKTASVGSGSLPAVTITDDTNYFITAKVNYSDGNVPKDNLGTLKEDLKIVAGSKTAVSESITGYRSFFYGVDNSNEIIDSDFVRKLTNGGDSSGSLHVINFSVDKNSDAKRFIIAVPTASGLKVSKAIITSSMNADATQDYKLLNSIEVAGVGQSNKVSYDIWSFQPSLMTAQKHTVTLKQ